MTKEIEELIQKAENGDMDAQNELGNKYYYGDGLEKSYDKAVEMFSRSANQGNVKAQYNLALCYQMGTGVKQSNEEAFKWYLKAANQNFAEAQVNLAICYAHGEGVEQSIEDAIKWYSKAANQDIPEAQHNLALCYAHGDGVEQSYKTAVYWYKKAAKLGLSSSQHNLALCYLNGQGVKKSFEEAAKWFKCSAEQGDAYAQCDLAVLYTNGMGIEQSTSKAVYWLKKSAKQNYDEAYVKLALLYFHGLGDIKRSYNKAISMLQKAVNCGNAFAQNMMGVILEDIDSTNYNKISKLYLSSMEQGYSEAYANYGRLLYLGKGLDKENVDDGIKYMLKAVEIDEDQGPICYYLLGNAFHNGFGVEQNLKIAKEYYLKASKKGYNCKYALEMVEDDIILENYYKKELAKIDIANSKRESIAQRKAKNDFENHLAKKGIRAYMKELLKDGLNNKERKEAIKNDLSKDFGNLWKYLKPNAQKSLITGFFVYSVFLDLGKEYYYDIDFSPVINQLTKAYEVEIREFFFKGYIKYLKNKGIDCSVFVRTNVKQQYPVINTIIDRRTGVETYSYFDEDSTMFTLGSLYYLITTQKNNIELEANFDDNKSSAKSRIKFGDDFTSRTVNEYVLEYAQLIFKEDAFSTDNRKNEIVNYLIDLSTDTKTIKDYRNPGSHEKTMNKDDAALTADYLVKIHKVIYNFIDKIKPKYLKCRGPKKLDINI